jgi:6-oxo-cyclohex-1-ene-carbonyl-CoA hydrolase
MVSGTLCEPFSAHMAYRLGICHEITPALKVDGEFVPNPVVVTDRFLDEFGRIVHGEFKTGAEFKSGRALIKRGEVDLSLLDEKVEQLCGKLLLTFPECMTKSLEELRKPKLNAWNRNKENSRAWLALNMMNEARTGFRAFNEGNREIGREIDFVALRQALARGVPWTPELIESLMPKAHDD